MLGKRACHFSTAVQKSLFDNGCFDNKIWLNKKLIDIEKAS